MLRSMTVTNYLGNSMTFPLEHPEESGFFVAGIDGLGPPKADIFMSGIAAYDGSVYNSAKVESRNINITLVYYGDNIELLRHTTYEFFPIKKEVTLKFINDSRELVISGFVESNEVGIFTSFEGSAISILCNDPWFKDAKDANVEQRFSNINYLFEFARYPEDVNQTLVGYELYPVVTETENCLEFSELLPNSAGVIQYDGDVEVGIIFTFRAFSATGDIKIYNTDTGDMMTISSSTIQKLTNNAIKSGDEIVISTLQGKKSAKLIRSGTTTNILSAIDKKSNWFKISKGANNFLFRTASGNGEVRVQVTTLYEGI